MAPNNGNGSGNPKQAGDGLTERVANLLLGALYQRESNLFLSRQTISPTTSRVLNELMHGDGPASKRGHREENKTSRFVCKMDKNGDGNIKEYTMINKADNPIKKEFPITPQVFKDQMGEVVNIMFDDEAQQYCDSMNELRIRDFNNYRLEFEEKKAADLLKISPLTYRTVQKNDPHNHLASCMHPIFLRQIMLLHVKKPEKIFDEDGVLRNMIEVLDLHSIKHSLPLKEMGHYADWSLFENFDNFKSKFLPFGIPAFKKIFLSVDNVLKGEPFAQVIHLATQHLEKLGNQTAELRINLHGSHPNEINIVAQWFDSYVHLLKSPCLKYLVQIPRRYNELVSLPKNTKNTVNHFGDFLYNIFGTIFENLSTDQTTDEGKVLRRFLDEITGFDPVDLESLVYNADDMLIEPQDWKKQQEPSDAYYDYYFFKLISQINFIKSVRNLNGYFSYRPHAGEHSNGYNLAAAYLTASSISHGTVLRHKENCSLVYLYYLSQVGITMAVRSNMFLCCAKKDSPIAKLLKGGALVTCSTDDPLIFNKNLNALLEEYETIADEFNQELNDIDMSEIAKNSLIISSFSDEVKSGWLCPIGTSYTSLLEFPNYPVMTNVPAERMAFRLKTLETHIRSLKL